MASLDETFEAAVKNGTIPGAVLLATDKSGTFTYSKAFGKTALNGDDLKTNSVFRIASMTKLLTSIAALQVVEKGLIALDDDVSHLVPDLGKQKILTGFDENSQPILVDRQNTITFRSLLTHSSGAAYTTASPRLAKYVALMGIEDELNAGPGKIAERFGREPLVYEPGTSWVYSTSIDWASQVIEKVTGETLEVFMQKNICQPLGIRGISFFADKNPDMASRLTGMTVRSSKGALNAFKGLLFTDNLEDCFGGQGAFADLEDYLKVLHSLLVDDERLLKRETAAQMFQPQLTKDSKAALSKIMYDPELVKAFVGFFPATNEYDWGIGGILVQKDEEVGPRKKGTLIWSGVANTYWFIDREAGLCGTFGTFVLPPADPKIQELIKAYELGMYKQMADETKSAQPLETSRL